MKTAFANTPWSLFYRFPSKVSATTGLFNISDRYSQGASASARLSQKVEAAEPPDPTKGSGRYSPERGCQVEDSLSMYEKREPFDGSLFDVRAKGIEPIRLSAPDPKSGLSTNFNTPANRIANVRQIMRFAKLFIRRYICF